MTLKELIKKYEEQQDRNLSETEIKGWKIMWNACVDCVADEWPVLGSEIIKLKE